MNLIEVLVASLLVSLSAVSSLGIWSQITLGVVQEERRQLLSERLEAELATLDANLRIQRRGLTTATCGASAAALQTSLAAQPVAAGVERRLKVLPGEDGVLLELSIEGLPLRRRRLYLPAALGLCDAPQPAAAAATTPATTPVAQSHG
jgi:hypothetical protein